VIDESVLKAAYEQSTLPPRAPAMEIIEEPSSFVLTCDMPGADREDIRVDVSPHRVVVAALPRAKETKPAKPGAPYQSFERAVPLPSEVDPESAEARLNNGVLEVVLPKKRLGGSGVYRLPAVE
jgi:HSP20 family protein